MMYFGSTMTKIVFFGSGPVASKSLELLAKDFEIEAVITKPHTAKEMIDVNKDTPVYMVSSKTDVDELIDKQEFYSKVAILIDFGIIVSQKVIDAFEKGIINSHFSLLPEWRGADPITFSILSGQKQTGISLMKVVEAMDEGPILAHAVYDLPSTITTPELTEDLISLSAQMLQEVVPIYLEGNVELSDQESIAELQGLDPTPTYSRKLTKQDGKIDWTKPAEQIEREIRAYAGWPKSYTKLGNVDIVITKVHILPSTPEEPGTIEIDQDLLIVSAKDGKLSIDALIPAGKKEMPIKAFLNGYKDKLAI